MRNVLLVDDESIDLIWMEKLIENSLPSVNVIQKVHSGQEGLKVMETEKVDIIVSDIRMPMMTGTDFAFIAKEMNPAVKIIFISGHKEFEYAKDAIQLNASGYLLKPVDDAEFIGLLTRVCEEIEASEQEYNKLTEILNVANQELLLRWLEGSSTGDGIEQIKLFLSNYANVKTLVILIELDELNWNIVNIEEEHRANYIAHVLEDVHRYLQEKQLGLIMFMKSSCVLMITDHDEDTVSNELEGLMQWLKEKSSASVTAGMSSYVTGLDSLQLAFRQAKSALSAKWFLGKSKLIKNVEGNETEAALSVDLGREVKQMFQSMLQYDLVGIDDHLSVIFSGIHAKTNRNEVYSLIVMMTSKLYAETAQINEDLYELLRWEITQLDVLFEFETVHDIQSWLRRCFFELSEILCMKKINQPRKLIENIMKYVEETIEERKTLKDLADHFQFSPNHLGFLFKKETGQNFTDYLIEARIKYACKLLHDPNVKVFEVSEKVGYKNILYFNRQFKQIMGLSPSSYRKKNKI